MTIILAVLTTPFALLTLCFAVEVFAGLKPLPVRGPALHQEASAVIVVPAHDEALVLEQRLAGLVKGAGERAKILLVADNCTDATAKVARECGVEVIERFDVEQRGKGYALDFARNHLQHKPPEVVLIIDADCRIDAQSIHRLIEVCAATSSPCQATNLQAPAPGGPPAVQLSTFAFYIRNVIRQRALTRLMGRVHLLGTGMAIPWPIFERASLATGDIVEDLKLGQELAAAGHPAIFVEDATVWSDAETATNTLSQRQRWEGGFLANAIRSAPLAFGRSLIRGDVGEIWAAIDLMIPPFALLILIDSLLLALVLATFFFTASSLWPAIFLASALLAAILALMLAWTGGGSRFVSLSGLARMPLYLAWKLPMYFAFARGGVPKDWIRTNRNRDG